MQFIKYCSNTINENQKNIIYYNKKENEIIPNYKLPNINNKNNKADKMLENIKKENKLNDK